MRHWLFAFTIVVFVDDELVRKQDRRVVLGVLKRVRNLVASSFLCFVAPLMARVSEGSRGSPRSSCFVIHLFICPPLKVRARRINRGKKSLCYVSLYAE